ncbi:MAG: hypothetical protein IK020_05540 [Clostridiales bacterium]|nr:hypothetical protein [Clostridiales bacterium]
MVYNSSAFRASVPRGTTKELPAGRRLICTGARVRKGTCRNMNAKRLIVTMVFAVILIVFFCWIIGVGLQDLGRKNRIWREQAQKVTDAITYINDAKVDVMYYGEDLKAPESFRVRHIYDFEQESLLGPEDNPEHDKHMIIVHDPHDNIPIRKEQWEQLFKLMKNNGYIIIYLGAAQLPVMQEVGFFFDVYPKGTRSVALWNKGDSKEIGFADDATVIPEVVRETLTAEQLPVYAMIMKTRAEEYV